MRFLGAATVTAGLLFVPLASADTFGRAAEIPLVAEPVAVVLSDATQDGRVDIVAANASAPGISVFTGRGDGSFERRIDFGAGIAARAIAAGDFGSDGSDDVAVAAGDSVTIFAGIDAGLVRGASYGIDAPIALAVADLDSDGQYDLVVASSTRSAVFVLHGLGDLTFDPPVEYEIGRPASSLFVGDLDGDDVPDIAAASGDAVFMLVGLGDATFDFPQVIAAPAGLRSIAGDDLDGDGKTDLILAGGRNQVFVGLNSEEAVFPEFAAYTVGGTPAQVAISDVDGNSVADVLTVNRGSDDVSVLRGEGDGTFGPQVRVRVGHTPTSLGLDDVDGDGTNDLVVTNRRSRSLTIRLSGADAPQPVVCLVPRVVGRKLPAARRTLNRANCALAPVRRRYSNRVARGRVIAQSPVPGLRLPEATRVSLLVSRGPRR